MITNYSGLGSQRKGYPKSAHPDESSRYQVTSHAVTFSENMRNTILRQTNLAQQFLQQLQINQEPQNMHALIAHLQRNAAQTKQHLDQPRSIRNNNHKTQQHRNKLRFKKKKDNSKSTFQTTKHSSINKEIPQLPLVILSKLILIPQASSFGLQISIIFFQATQVGYYHAFLAAYHCLHNYPSNVEEEGG